MSEDARETLREILLSRRIAALGTLHRGEPSVSMVPFAILPDGSGIVIHVSRLSPHTADMVASPRVSLLIAGAEREGLPAQAVPRVTLQGDARQPEDSSNEESDAREAYLSRFPDAGPIFEIPGFLLFVIRPASIRVIGGFGRAATLGPEDFRNALPGADSPS